MSSRAEHEDLIVEREGMRAFIEPREPAFIGR